ncbi:peptidyl-tRNA hydrolase, chloroplastic, partial [Tanacetum coccineum]
VGFEMVDAIAEAEDISMKSVSYKAFFGKGSIGNIPLLLAKPQTFMNVSGESVGAIVSFYKIPPKQVLVIYDDLDLPFGKLRMLPKGGHGGHNGMKSVINHLKGSRDFPRLRIGIDYLHEYADSPIVPRDIKSINILLTNWNAIISDFGSAVMIKVFVSYGSIKPEGTHGNLDLEYLKGGGFKYKE